METKDEKLPATINFQDYVDINSKMLRIMCLAIDVDGNKRDRKSNILEKLPTFITNIVCLWQAYCQILWIKDLWEYDINMVTLITTSGISNLVCVCKGFRLAYCREDLQTIFESLSKIWEECRIPVAIEQDILIEAQKTLIFCKRYIVMMSCLALSFGLPPLKHVLLQYLMREKTNYTYDFSQTVYPMNYPFQINTLTIYYLVLIEEEWLMFSSILYWVCCDILFAQLTTHLSLQFQVLRYDIEMVGSDNEDDIEKTIINFIKRHQELLRMIELTEKIFSPVLFTTMLLTSINICVNVFELSQMVSSGQYEQTAVLIFHVINILVQLFVYCTYAEKLTQEASSIADAAYNCRWTDKSCKFWTYFQRIIMRSQKPFYLNGCGVFRIGHKRISDILRRAMSFYMLLQRTD